MHAASTRDNSDLNVGIDEVGRGCIAGPVVAAAIMIPKHVLAKIAVADSKKLSAIKREQLAAELLASATSWGIGVIGVKIIDDINILQATMHAMQTAVQSCWLKPDYAWVDGRDVPKLTIPAKAIIGGDSQVPLISAAGIIAKVYRDSLMQVYAKQFPHYGFAKHKGYGTKLHLEMLQQHGVCSIHRKSFAPVSLVHRQNVNKACATSM